MPNISDYIWQNVSGVIVPRTLVWVRLTNNVSGISYVSVTQTDANGLFNVNNVPAGTYTVATGPTSGGAWTGTGDTAYVVAEELGYFNVKDYGAKGDGTTDDSLSIQTTINAAAVAGGIVFLPVGTYKIVTTLSITTSNVEIRGSGMASIMKLANSANTILLSISGSGVTNIRLYNFQIDGNKANNASGGNGISINTPYVSADTWHVLEDLIIVNAKGHGLQILGDTREIHARNVQSSGNGLSGFEVGGGDHKWSGCVAGNNTQHGFHYSAGGGGQYIGCKAFGSGFGGGVYRNFMIEGATTDVQLVDCWSQDGNAEGFVLFGSGVARNQLIGCRSTQSGRTFANCAGFKLDGCTDNVLIGCIGTDPQVTKTQAYGLQIANAATGNKVIGGVFTGNLTKDIDLSLMTGTTNTLFSDAACQFNVKDFGAKGDGVTNDAAAILAAVATANALGGGTIFFPKATYVVASTITINKAGISLLGAGSINTIIKYTGSSDLLRIQDNPFSPFDEGGFITGLTLDGASAGAGACGLHYGDMIGGTFDDLVVQHFFGVGSKGIWIDNRTNWTERTIWRRVWIYNNKIGVLFDVNGGLNSMGYQNVDWLVINTNDGQVGVQAQNDATFYNGHFTLRGNASEGGAGSTVWKILDTAKFGGPNGAVTFDVAVEANGGSPVGLNIAAGASLSGTGSIDFGLGFTNIKAVGPNINFFSGRFNCPGIGVWNSYITGNAGINVVMDNPSITTKRTRIDWLSQGVGQYSILTDRNGNNTQDIGLYDLLAGAMRWWVDSTGDFRMGNAVARITGGATSLSLRNNANTLDNLGITDAGVATIRAGLVITAGNATLSSGDLTITSGKITMGTAASKLVPGGTSFTVRNNANTLDNLLIGDDGSITLRNRLTITGDYASIFDSFVLGSTTAATKGGWIGFADAGAGKWELGKESNNTLTLYDSVRGASAISAASNGDMSLMPSAGDVIIGGSGNLKLGAAASKIVPGATSFSHRNNANNADNLLITDAGDATLRGSFTMSDAKNIVLQTTTGTQLGTATGQKLAFHGSTAVIQRASASQAATAATAATNTTPFGYTTAAQADAIVTLVNELRAAMVEKGLIKGSA